MVNGLLVSMSSGVPVKMPIGLSVETSSGPSEQTPEATVVSLTNSLPVKPTNGHLARLSPYHRTLAQR